MSHQEKKFVRFGNWKSEKSTEGQYSKNYGMQPGKIRTVINLVSEKFQRGFESSSERIRTIKKSFKSYSFNGSAARGVDSRKKILDPQGPFLQKWNKIFVLSCVIAVSLDPLFFYVPLINDDRKCIELDKTMETTAIILRTFTDLFYILHIILQFRTGFIAPSSRVFGRGVLVEDAGPIARRYMSSYFLIDILAVLPLPQAVILIVVPALRGSRPLNTKNLLKFVVFFQYLPRFLRIYPLYNEVTRTSGILTQTAWAGAAFNLFLYMLASHVLGAFWYLFSIERETTCWQNACGNNTTCTNSFLFCTNSTDVNSHLDTLCSVQAPNTTFFDFGIFLDALDSGVVGSTDFPQKLFYCFWWGLQNLRHTCNPQQQGWRR